MSSSGITPTSLMQMATGFWVSKTLMTAAEMDVFTKISSYQKNKNVESITLEEALSPQLYIFYTFQRSSSIAPEVSIL
jgi:hypothetical protein